MPFKWRECFPYLTGEKESSVFIWPIEATSNVPLLISILAFFITSWDNFFFLSLPLFFSFSMFSSQDKFRIKIWFQKQRRVTINNMSNSGNNKQLWSIQHKLKEGIDFKIKKPLVWIKRIATQNNHTYF